MRLLFREDQVPWDWFVNDDGIGIFRKQTIESSHVPWEGQIAVYFLRYQAGNDQRKVGPQLSEYPRGIEIGISNRRNQDAAIDTDAHTRPRKFRVGPCAGVL